MAIIKQGYRRVTDELKKLRDLWGLISGLVLAVVSILAWSSAYFVTASAAEVAHKELVQEMSKVDQTMAEEIRKTNEVLSNLSKEVKRSNDLLILHMDKHTLESVNSDIKATESEIFALEQFMRVNGSDHQSEQRLQQLKSSKNMLEIRRKCIIDKNQICG